MERKGILQPEQALTALRDRIPAYIRWTFLMAVVLGLITHLYIFANKLPNHDDVGHLFSASYGTQSGRWLLPTVLQWDGSYSMPWLIGVLSILCLAVTACLAVSLLRIRSRRRLGWQRTALVVVLVILYPLAGNLIRIMTNGMRVHSLMIYGMVFLPVAPVALAEYAAALPGALPDRKQAACTVIGWFLLGSMALTAWSYVVTDNQAYLKMQITFDQSMSYSNRLPSAIESCDDYERGLSVVLVGSNAYTGDLYPTPSLNAVQLTGVPGLAEVRTSYTYQYFLRYYLGFTDAVHLNDSAEAAALAETEAVREMPVYPADGSVRRIGDSIVVKLGPTEPDEGA